MKSNHITHGINSENLTNILDIIDGDNRYQIIANALHSENYIVTPKEIDSIIQKISEIIASGINKAI